MEKSKAKKLEEVILKKDSGLHIEVAKNEHTPEYEVIIRAQQFNRYSIPLYIGYAGNYAYVIEPCKSFEGFLKFVIF